MAIQSEAGGGCLRKNEMKQYKIKFKKQSEVGKGVINEKNGNKILTVIESKDGCSEIYYMYPSLLGFA